ncbi:ankyrin, partial [Lindgomyces ingoldianus]
MLLSYRGLNVDVKILLDHGARPDIADNDGVTSLHFAAQLSDHELCETLLSYHGVEINAKENLSGETPLHWAFRWSDPPTELLELLIARGANVNEQDNDSQAPLYEAANVGDANGVKVLLSHGADIDDDEEVFGRTALHAAIYAQSEDAVKVLIEAGADLALKTKAGMDALAQAVDIGHLGIFQNIVDVLMEKGIFEEKCLQQDSLENWTPLHCAVENRDMDMIKILLEKCDPFKMLPIKDRRGDTALHIAAGKSFCKGTLFLLEAGADPIAKNNFDLTPIDLAIR